MLLRSAVKHTLDRAADAGVRAIAVPGIGAFSLCEPA